MEMADASFKLMLIQHIKLLFCSRQRAQVLSFMARFPEVFFVKQILKVSKKLLTQQTTHAQTQQ